MAPPLDAVVVGLGKVASRFDEEPGRTAVWSHVGAYLARPDRFRLAGACEPAPVNAAAFAARCPEVPVYRSAAELAAGAPFEVASICTPPRSHREVLEALLDVSGLKVVWCEKPLAAGLDDAAAMAAACARRGVTLVVSHVRRWAPLWRRLRDLVEGGAVGRVRCVRVAMPNRLRSIGSHAVDLALMLGGGAAGGGVAGDGGAGSGGAGSGGANMRALDIPALAEDGELARAALIALAGGAYAIVQVTGVKSGLVVEAEVIGDEGRLLAREDRGTLTLERFEDSPHYAGYRQLGQAVTETVAAPADFSPFIAIAEEVARLAGGEGAPTCGAEEALAVMQVLERMAAA